MSLRKLVSGVKVKIDASIPVVRQKGGRDASKGVRGTYAVESFAKAGRDAKAKNSRKVIDRVKDILRKRYILFSTPV